MNRVILGVTLHHRPCDLPISYTKPMMRAFFFPFQLLEYPDIASENQDLIVSWYIIKPQP